jgi:hypothetical protein
MGLRFPHIEEVLASRPDVACFEVHPENFMHNEAALAALEKVRERYPLSLHGVARRWAQPKSSTWITSSV